MPHCTVNFSHHTSLSLTHPCPLQVDLDTILEEVELILGQDRVMQCCRCVRLILAPAAHAMRSKGLVYMGEKVRSLHKMIGKIGLSPEKWSGQAVGPGHWWVKVVSDAGQQRHIDLTASQYLQKLGLRYLGDPTKPPLQASISGSIPIAAGIHEECGCFLVPPDDYHDIRNIVQAFSASLGDSAAAEVASIFRLLFKDGKS